MNWSPRLNAHLFLWLGIAALTFGLFVDITKDLIEGEVDLIDRTILLTAVRARTPWLTVAAVDLTALGAVSLMILISLFAGIVLLMRRDRVGVLQLLTAAIGAVLWMEVTKGIFGRPRPEFVPPLVEVTGSAYPSGHALVSASVYLSIAILTAHQWREIAGRMVLLAMAGLVIVLVGLSRVYLGVHYPSDVASGIALGAAWAFLLAGFFSVRSRAPQQSFLPPTTRKKSYGSNVRNDLV